MCATRLRPPVAGPMHCCKLSKRPFAHCICFVVVLPLYPMCSLVGVAGAGPLDRSRGRLARQPPHQLHRHNGQALARGPCLVRARPVPTRAVAVDTVVVVVRPLVFRKASMVTQVSSRVRRWDRDPMAGGCLPWAGQTGLR